MAQQGVQEAAGRAISVKCGCRAYAVVGDWAELDCWLSLVFPGPSAGSALFTNHLASGPVWTLCSQRRHATCFAHARGRFRRFTYPLRFVKHETNTDILLYMQKGHEKKAVAM
jgi:hypothetical protein